ncbi:MAG: WG repeat-containing protein [Candidatus Melainabacteria bacterium]|nr:WG repeat-containing protein [Candidatus Melainabacteria bacterium]
MRRKPSAVTIAFLVLTAAPVPGAAANETTRTGASPLRLAARGRLGLSDPQLFYIDKEGKRAVPYSFEQAMPFSEGVAPVLLDRQWSYIDRSGDLKIGADYKLAKPFSEGMAAVKVDEDWGFIDRSGELKIQPRFAAVRPFHDGLAIAFVRKGSKEFQETPGDDLKTLLADPNRSNMQKALLAIAGSRKAGFIDRDGKFVIPPVYSSLMEFSDGLALARDKDGFVFLDKTGKVAIKPQCTRAESFSQGLAAIEVDKKWGFIDTSGRTVIKPRFEEAGSFEGELAPAKEGGKFGFIDRTGKWQIKPEYDMVWEGFRDGTAVVGRDVSPIPNSFADVTRFGDGYIITRKKGASDDFDESTTPLEPGYFAYPDLKFALLTREGKTLCKFEYEQIGRLADGLRSAKVDGSFGYIDNSGNLVIKPQYKWANDFSEGVALVREGASKSRNAERAETLLKHSVPSMVNDPELIEKDIAVADQVIVLDPGNTQALRDRGYLRCCLGQFDKSLEDFTRVIELCPTSKEGYYWRGHSYMQLEKYASALGDFLKASRLDTKDSRDPGIYAASAVAMLKLDKPDAALKAIDAAIKIVPDSYYKNIRAAILDRLGKPEEALKERWNGRLASNPFPWPTWPESQSDLEAERRKKEKAYEELKGKDNKEAFAFAATDLADSIDSLRRLKAREKKMLELEDLYRRSLSLREEALDAIGSGRPVNQGIARTLKADRANSMAQLSSWYAQAGRLEEADKLVSQALEQARDINDTIKIADYLNDLARINLTRKDNVRAQECLEESLKITDGATSNLMKIVRGQTLSTYAMLLSRTGQEAASQEKLEEASRLLKFGSGLAYMPSPPRAARDATASEMLELAIQCHGLFLLDTSRQFAMKAMELVESQEKKDHATKKRIDNFLKGSLPAEPVDLPLTKEFLVAQTAELAGDLLSAESFYNRCVEKESKFEPSYVALGRINRLTGSLSKAEKMVRKAIAINPNHVQAWLELSRINLERGRKRQALTAIEEALNIDPDNQMARFEKEKLEREATL